MMDGTPLRSKLGVALTIYEQAGTSAVPKR
jgi:hypothetical protein